MPICKLAGSRGQRHKELEPEYRSIHYFFRESLAMTKKKKKEGEREGEGKREDEVKGGGGVCCQFNFLGMLSNTVAVHSDASSLSCRKPAEV